MDGQMTKHSSLISEMHKTLNKSKTGTKTFNNYAQNIT